MITAVSQVGEGAGDQHASDLPHILLVLDQFPKTLGGGERIVLRLAGLLPRYGYRASILTFAVHPECTGLEKPPCPIYLLPLQKTYDLTALRGAFELRAFLRQQKIKVVHTFFESSDIWAGFVTKAFSDAKLVWSRRDMGILRTSKHEVAYRLMSGFPDAVFAVSELVRQHCIEVDRVDPKRVETVYNGLDLAEWESVVRPGSQDGIRIVTVGNIRRVKGHDVLIRAAASIAQRFPAATFSVAGEVLEREYFEELQQLVEELGLSDRFEFAGGIRRLREYLAGVDIFVLPSRSEGFSNAIVEAMAASLPVVATDVGGNAEAVENGSTGIIVPPEDAEALASAMAELLADPERARQMGAMGKRVVADRFTTDAMMRRIVSAYGRMLAAQ